MNLQISETYELVGEGEELPEALSAVTLDTSTADPNTGNSGSGSSTADPNAAGPSQWLMPVMLIIIVVAFIAFLFLSGRKNRARDKEFAEQLDAIKPGNKIMSRGGLCGIVVEVCDDNTVVIETGSENTGKSYFKLAKECIYETDAKGPTQLAREEAELRRKAEKEAKEAAKAEASAPAPAEKPEEAPEEKPAEPSAADGEDPSQKE